MSGDPRHELATRVLALLLSANPRSIARDASFTDRLMVRRSSLLALRDAFDAVYPGEYARARAALDTALTRVDDTRRDAARARCRSCGYPVDETPLVDCSDHGATTTRDPEYVEWRQQYDPDAADRLANNAEREHGAR